MLSWLFGRGGRARQVLMYTRKGCHLCDDAWELLQRAAKRHHLSLSKLDVDKDAALVERYGDCVPVVLIDGKVRFRGVVNEVLLERVLRHEPKDGFEPQSHRDHRASTEQNEREPSRPDSCSS
jgi:hypothetical protein